MREMHFLTVPCSASKAQRIPSKYTFKRDRENSKKMQPSFFSAIINSFQEFQNTSYAYSNVKILLRSRFFSSGVLVLVFFALKMKEKIFINVSPVNCPATVDYSCYSNAGVAKKQSTSHCNFFCLFFLVNPVVCLHSNFIDTLSWPQFSLQVLFHYSKS